MNHDSSCLFSKTFQALICFPQIHKLPRIRLDIYLRIMKHFRFYQNVGDDIINISAQMFLSFIHFVTIKPMTSDI